jgi:hypothetical protein
MGITMRQHDFGVDESVVCRLLVDGATRAVYWIIKIRKSSRSFLLIFILLIKINLIVVVFRWLNAITMLGLGKRFKDTAFFFLNFACNLCRYERSMSTPWYLSCLLPEW